MEANEKNEDPSSHSLNISAEMADNLTICTYRLVQISDCSCGQCSKYSIDTSLKVIVEILQYVEMPSLKTYKQ